MEKSLRDLEMQRLELKEEGDALNAELDSLGRRRSQIPAHDLALRRRILDALDTNEEDVPFVGELLQETSSPGGPRHSSGEATGLAWSGLDISK